MADVEMFPQVMHDSGEKKPGWVGVFIVGVRLGSELVPSFFLQLVEIFSANPASAGN